MNILSLALFYQFSIKIVTVVKGNEYIIIGTVYWFSIKIVTIVKGDEYIIIGTVLPVSETTLKIHVKLVFNTANIVFLSLASLSFCMKVIHYSSVVPEI